MSRPPAILDLAYGRPGRGLRHLWLPVFLLWPLLAILGLIAVALTLAVDAVWRVTGQNGGHWTALLFATYEAVVEATGLEITVHGPRTTVDLRLK